MYINQIFYTHSPSPPLSGAPPGIPIKPFFPTAFYFVLTLSFNRLFFGKKQRTTKEQAKNKQRTDLSARKRIVRKY